MLNKKFSERSRKSRGYCRYRYTMLIKMFRRRRGKSSGHWIYNVFNRKFPWRKSSCWSLTMHIKNYATTVVAWSLKLNCHIYFNTTKLYILQTTIDEFDVSFKQDGGDDDAESAEGTIEFTPSGQLVSDMAMEKQHNWEIGTPRFTSTPATNIGKWKLKRRFRIPWWKMSSRYINWGGKMDIA